MSLIENEVIEGGDIVISDAKTGYLDCYFKDVRITVESGIPGPCFCFCIFESCHLNVPEDALENCRLIVMDRLKDDGRIVAQPALETPHAPQASVRH